VHQFLTQPLLARFILPTLEQWVREVPDSQVGVRWLGMLRRERPLLNRALELQPADVEVRRVLADWILSDVDHATHHLVESRFLGDLKTVWHALAEARDLLEAAPDASLLADLAREIDDFTALLKDWESFADSGETNFPEWCADRGRSYKWRTIVYYDR
jgi:hypothetical protein